MARVSEFDPFGIENMGKEEYAKRQSYVTQKCLCTRCPTYVKGDSPTGYCYPLIGTSKLIHSEKDCICETCPVYKEYDLNRSFYCTRCSQLCQTYKMEVGGMPGG